MRKLYFFAFIFGLVAAFLLVDSPSAAQAASKVNSKQTVAKAVVKKPAKKIIKSSKKKVKMAVNYAHVAPDGETFASFYASRTQKQKSCIVGIFGKKVVQNWIADPLTSLNLTQVAKIDRCAYK